MLFLWEVQRNNLLFREYAAVAVKNDLLEPRSIN